MIKRMDLGDVLHTREHIEIMVLKFNEIIDYLNTQSQFRDYAQSSLKLCTQFHASERNRLLDLISMLMAKIIYSDIKERFEIIKNVIEQLKEIDQ